MAKFKIKQGQFLQHKKDGYVVKVAGVINEDSLSAKYCVLLDWEITDDFSRSGIISERDIRKDFRLIDTKKQAIMANTLYGSNPVQKGE
jgi:hypothetical protein